MPPTWMLAVVWEEVSRVVRFARLLSVFTQYTKIFLARFAKMARWIGGDGLLLHVHDAKFSV